MPRSPTLLELMNATPPPSLRKGHFCPPDQLIALLTRLSTPKVTMTFLSGIPVHPAGEIESLIWPERGKDRFPLKMS
jgi:hypothetical protein